MGAIFQSLGRTIIAGLVILVVSAGWRYICGRVHALTGVLYGCGRGVLPGTRAAWRCASVYGCNMLLVTGDNVTAGVRLRA